MCFGILFLFFVFYFFQNLDELGFGLRNKASRFIERRMLEENLQVIHQSVLAIANES